MRQHGGDDHAARLALAGSTDHPERAAPVGLDRFAGRCPPAHVGASRPGAAAQSLLARQPGGRRPRSPPAASSLQAPAAEHVGQASFAVPVGPRTCWRPRRPRRLAAQPAAAHQQPTGRRRGPPPHRRPREPRAQHAGSSLVLLLALSFAVALELRSKPRPGQLLVHLAGRQPHLLAVFVLPAGEHR